jgi:hypothetical protein
MRCPIAIKRDLLRVGVIRDGPLEEAPGSLYISMRSTRVDRAALLIDCAVEIGSFPLYLDVGLIDSPGRPHRFGILLPSFLEDWNKSPNPPHNRVCAGITSRSPNREHASR